MRPAARCATLAALLLIAGPASAQAEPPSLRTATPAQAPGTAVGGAPGTAAGTDGAGSRGARPRTIEHWGWPLTHPSRPLRRDVLRSFDPPDQPWLSGHRGVDLRASDGDGAAILSPTDGVVSFRGTVVDRPVITIDHGDDVKSSFEPVESDLKVGQSVRRGQRIGTLHPGHCAVSVCVHWGVRQDGDYVDPLRFIQDLRPSILLPWS